MRTVAETSKLRTVVVRTSTFAHGWVNMETGKMGQCRDEVEANFPHETIMEVTSYSQDPLADPVPKSTQDVLKGEAQYYRVEFYANEGTEGTREVYIPARTPEQALEFFFTNTKTIKLWRTLNHPPKITVVSVRL